MQKIMKRCLKLMMFLYLGRECDCSLLKNNLITNCAILKKKNTKVSQAKQILMSIVFHWTSILFVREPSNLERTSSENVYC